MTPRSIGVVVPVFNGERFIRETLRSLKAQARPELRVLVMDGGSRDGTIDIVKDEGIAFVSEKDEGQADAIDRGFARLSDCDLIGWLNADDRLLPGAIERVLALAAARPEAVLFSGAVELVDIAGRLIDTAEPADNNGGRLARARGKVLQPGSFYRRAAVEAAGGVDKSFHLAMDVDLWIRLLRHGAAATTPERVAQFRIHPDAKSSQAPWRYYRETLRLGLLHDPQRVRGLVRRGVNIGLHLISFKLGLRRNHPRPMAPVRSPRRVGLAGGASLPCGWPTTDHVVRGGADVDVVMVPASEAEPFVGRAPVVALLDPAFWRLRERRAAALRRRVAVFGGARDELTRLALAYVPTFRLVERDDAAGWARAARLVDGASPDHHDTSVRSTSAAN